MSLLIVLDLFFCFYVIGNFAKTKCYQRRVLNLIVKY